MEESNTVSNLASDNKAGRREPDLFVMSMITDQIGWHKFLLQINHKNYNFPETKNSQVIKKTDKGGINC